MTGHLAFLSAFILIAVVQVFPQELPNEIRGYKVHREKIPVSSKSGSTADDAGASVTVGEPNLVELAVTGITFELPAEFFSAKQSGKIDFITFRDIRVNGISVDVEEYDHPFTFTKGRTVRLPKPARIFLGITGLAQAAWREMREQKDEWSVTGRVFVFGRFRCYGFYHKRVVPIDFAVTIANPVRPAADSH